jgi:glucosamine-6-phosphate deaminase
MRLDITDDYSTLSAAAAGAMAAVIAEQPQAVVVPATGNTPTGAYTELAARRQAGQLETGRLRVFQLDEYLGVPLGDPRSLFDWMWRGFVEPLGIPGEQVVRLPGDAPDPRAACRAHDQALVRAGGADLAVLGIGPNGHLGFNEPPSPPDAPSRVVTLTEASLESSAAYWNGRERVPRQALTLGLASLLGARRILVLASGAAKHAILRAALEGPVTPDVPASYLQRAPQATVIADRAAWEG